MTDSISAPDGASRRAHIEALLAAYPEIDPEETAVLFHWFRKEASALEVGLIASDPSLSAGYDRFKADHLDRFSGADLMSAILFVLLAGGFLFMLIWFS